MHLLHKHPFTTTNTTNTFEEAFFGPPSIISCQNERATGTKKHDSEHFIHELLSDPYAVLYIEFGFRGLRPSPSPAEILEWILPKYPPLISKFRVLRGLNFSRASRTDVSVLDSFLP